MTTDSTEIWEILIRLVSNEISLSEAHSQITGETCVPSVDRQTHCSYCGEPLTHLTNGSYCTNEDCSNC